MLDELVEESDELLITDNHNMRSARLTMEHIDRARELMLGRESRRIEANHILPFGMDIVVSDAVPPGEIRFMAPPVVTTRNHNDDQVDALRMMWQAMGVTRRVMDQPTHLKIGIDLVGDATPECNKLQTEVRIRRIER